MEKKGELVVYMTPGGGVGQDFHAMRYCSVFCAGLSSASTASSACDNCSGRQTTDALVIARAQDEKAHRCRQHIVGVAGRCCSADGWG